MSPPIGSLYVCYLTIADPLVDTQVIAYVEGLAAAGHHMHLLTFEPKDSMSSAEAAERRADLERRGITWHRARYHKRFSLPATIGDAVVGAALIRRITRKHGLDLVHARSHVPAAMALLARRLGGPPFIFDIRGLMAEEYVDAGRWRQDGLPFRITKNVERRAIDACAGAVVLTKGARDLLFPPAPDIPIEVIPCCVDLSHFPERSRPLSAEAPVFAYVGKFGGWYMDAEMARVFERALRIWPESRFRILTQGDPSDIRRFLEAAGVDAGKVSTASVPAAEVGRELASADVGLSLVRPVPSKVASSPTKNAEYLAAGMPLLATAGVAGTDDLAESFPGVVVPLECLDGPAIETGLRHIGELLTDSSTTGRCREAADSLSLAGRGIPAYQQLYRAVASRVGR